MQEKTPLFSILIANYNNGQFLEKCLHSVFTQTYTNWQIIIVDDASTDNSIKIYNRFNSNPQIKVYFNRINKGCGFTKKTCVEKATGEICGFLDPDDTLSPNAIETMVNLHMTNPDISIAYSTHYVCDSNLRVKHIASHPRQINNDESYLTCGTGVITAFATFKREKYLKTIGINTILPKAVDQDLYLKLEETGRTLYLPTPLYYYRHHSNSISLNQNLSEASLFAKKCQIDAYKRRCNAKLFSLNITKEVYNNINREYFNLLINAAIQHSKQKHYKSMYGFLFEAFKRIQFDSKLSTLRVSLSPFKGIFCK